MEKPIMQPPENDSIIAAFNRAVASFQDFAKVIYIAEPNFFFKYTTATELAKRLKQQLSLKELNKNLTVRSISFLRW